jgi:hypothetical protein
MNGINWGNNGLINSPYNFIPQMQQFQTQAPHMEVIRVNGENGVNAFQMGPNSSALLLDENDPIVWFVQTDGAGYKTKTPYDIAVHTPEPSPEIKTMDQRLSSIDKRLQAIEEAMRDESDN